MIDLHRVLMAPKMWLIAICATDVAVHICYLFVEQHYFGRPAWPKTDLTILQDENRAISTKSPEDLANGRTDNA